MALGKLAEGEELGSNLLHVGQSTAASSCVRSSWQRRGQGHHEPEAPPGQQPAPSILGKNSVAYRGSPSGNVRANVRNMSEVPCPLVAEPNPDVTATCGK